MKYKSKMSFWFSKIAKVKRYYLSDYHYRELLNKYNDILIYYNLIKEIPNKNPKYTSETIKVLDNTSLENITQKKVKGKFGEPNWMINYKQYSYNITIIFYRIILGGYKTKLEFHFVNNELFFYNYHFSYLNDSDRHKLLKILEKKYLNNNTFKWKNDFIVDKENSIITLENSINFKINYIVQNKDFFNQIKKIVLQQKLKNNLKKKIKNKELLEKL